MNYQPEIFKIKEYTCYITKNWFNAWLAYIDVTDFKELHITDINVLDSFLPFHGGCTYSEWTKEINYFKFQKKRFLIGCDWNHGIINNKLSTAPFKKDSFDFDCVEDVSKDDVKENLREVIEMLPELRLKMIIQNGC